MVKVIVSDAAEQDEKLTKIQKKAVIADTPKQKRNCVTVKMESRPSKLPGGWIITGPK